MICVFICTRLGIINEKLVLPASEYQQHNLGTGETRCFYKFIILCLLLFRRIPVGWPPEFEEASLKTIFMLLYSSVSLIATADFSENFNYSSFTLLVTSGCFNKGHNFRNTANKENLAISWILYKFIITVLNNNNMFN